MRVFFLKDALWGQWLLSRVVCDYVGINYRCLISEEDDVCMYPSYVYMLMGACY